MSARVMQTCFKRRAMLAGALGAAAGCLLPRFAGAQGGAAITPLGEDLHVLSGLGGNIVVLALGDGQLLVDSGAAEHGPSLLAALVSLPGAGQVETLFNTHWHAEQTGSNETLGRGGTTIIAHEKTRLRLSTDYYLPVEDRYEQALPAAARPTESFYVSGAMTAGARQIEYGYLLEAHTDGDIYVYFRDANVIAAGDAIAPVADPELDWFGGGWLGGRLDALAMLLEISDAQTRFVPSRGPLVGRAEVQAEHDMTLVLFERMVELVRKGMGAEDVLAAGVMDGLERSFDDPLKFVYAAHKGLWAHHNTLSHDVV